MTLPRNVEPQFQMNPTLLPETTIEFDAKVFRLSAVKKAAYRIGHHCFVEVDLPETDRIRVKLTARTSDCSLDFVVGQFRNEVLDQELRECVLEETERIRNLILAQAFSGISLTDQTGETADFRLDPLGIASDQ